MSTQCSICKRQFTTPHDLQQHAKRKHKVKPDRARRDDEPSLADDAIEAQRKAAAGLPLSDYEKGFVP